MARRPLRWWYTQLVILCWWASSLLMGHWGKSRAVSARHSVWTATPRPRVPSALTNWLTAHFRYSDCRRADIMHAARAFTRWISPTLLFSPVGVDSLNEENPVVYQSSTLEMKTIKFYCKMQRYCEQKYFWYNSCDTLAINTGMAQGSYLAV